MGGLSFAPSGALSCALLALLLVQPLRTRGQTVALHTLGLDVSPRSGIRDVVPFEDVDELWIEVSFLHNGHGALLRALRLVDFDGRSHHVPVDYSGGAAVANAVVKACSAPLLVEARSAIASGATLTFADVRLDRNGITVGPQSAPWSELRLARLESDRVRLFRRLPVWSWATIRLTRVPNPTVLTALIGQLVRDVRRDQQLLVELDDAGQSVQPAARHVYVGLVFLVLGAAVTYFSFVVAIGPIVYGAARLVQALLASRR